MRKLKVEVEFSSIFNKFKYLEAIRLSGTRIRKPDFRKKFYIFMKSLQK